VSNHHIDANFGVCHANLKKSDFAIFKEITAKLNVSMKHRLGKTAFDQQTHVNQVLSMKKSKNPGVSNEHGRFLLIKEII